jgi:hypothetical protein
MEVLSARPLREPSNSRQPRSLPPIPPRGRRRIPGSLQALENLYEQQRNTNVMQITLVSRKLREFINPIPVLCRPNAQGAGGAARPCSLEHDPEKSDPVFPKRSCSNNQLEWDDEVIPLGLFRNFSKARPHLPGRVGWVKGAFAAAPQIERISAATGPVIPQT